MRDQRRQRGLDQSELAAKIGATRQWVIAVEKGKPGAAVGLILRALDALGLSLSADRLDATGAKPFDVALSVDSAGANAEIPSIDIDRIVDEARKPPR
jgi:HTH-type transcriptional regulator / antitoxin HipB